TADSIAKTYRAVTTADELAALADRLRKAGRFALSVLTDRVTDRPAAMTAAIVGLAFSTSPRDADYVPIGHRALGAMPLIPFATPLDGLRAVLEDPSIKKIGHDLKFDAIVLERHGIVLGGLDLDTMLASYLVDATRSEHRLQDLALELVSYKAIAEEDVCGRGAKAVSLSEVPVEAALDYAAEHA